MRMRRRAARSISGSNTSAWPLPRDFAAYIAASALRMSRSTLLTRSASATPTLQPMRNWRPSISNGWRQDSRTWRATAIAASTFGRVIDEHRELVAAEPRDRVAGARALHETVREVAQQRIARAVPEAVVDGLEIVEVDEQHGRRHAVADVPDRLVHAVGEQRAIGEQRQRIVESQRAQLVVQARGIGYVADVQRDAADRFDVA